MRLFVAITLPGELRERIAALGNGLEEEGIARVRPENMHLTLRFIGDTDERTLPSIVQALQGVRFVAFECFVRGAGAFPDEEHAGVVWAGVASGGALESLAAAVNDALRGAGGDERFSAHITIARLRRRIGLGGFLERHRNDVFGSFTVSSFELIESALGSAGPKYTTIKRFAAEGGDG